MQTGIIRDIMQNHLLQVIVFSPKFFRREILGRLLTHWHKFGTQLFMFTVMEPPQGGSDSVAANKVKLLQCISELKMSDTVLGQFEGYLADDTVPEGSLCPCVMPSSNGCKFLRDLSNAMDQDLCCGFRGGRQRPLGRSTYDDNGR
eukprot:SAG31_NODE_578_length_13949_cov_5.041372_5_plen_146_part_00